MKNPAKKMQEVKAQIKASGNKAEMIENCGMPDEKFIEVWKKFQMMQVIIR